MDTIKLNGYDLTLEDLMKVCRYGYKVELTEEAIERIQTARNIVDDLVEQEKVSYGITTGFGKFSDVVISKKDTRQLQINLIRSHACGVGEPLS